MRTHIPRYQCGTTSRETFTWQDQRDDESKHNSIFAGAYAALLPDEVIGVVSLTEQPREAAVAYQEK
jgi:hypothetical protein